MTDCRVIPARDADAWCTALADFSEADVYHDPAYVAAVAVTDDSAANADVHPELWLVSDGDASLALTLIRRRLPAWLDQPGYDAEIPNGYGAPLSRGAGAQLWPQLLKALAQAGVVNVFMRLHPFIPLHVEPAWLIGTPHPTVWIPLDAGVAGAFAGGRCATHRSQIARAERLGHQVSVIAAPTAEQQTGFRALYATTMERLHATGDYRFGDRYFAQLSRLDAPTISEKKLALVTVHDAAGLLVNAAQVLRGPRWAHYHLSARHDSAHNSSGHLLFSAAVTWAAAHGCAGIHLGGGTTNDPADPLLAYKRRIGRGDAEFRIAGLIADPVRHADLAARWSARSGRAPRWFQAYREPVA